ncbi:MAG: hypothetical protein LAQ30_26835, partial [Acidobacteriia bacterium]|nr:hypothetical protein [Terriglobia bacterium]
RLSARDVRRMHLSDTRPTSASYLKYVQKIREGVSASVKPVIDTAGADRKLGIASALDTFSRADVRSFGAVFAAHVTLLNRLDVAATLSRQPERTLTARAPRAGRQSA